MTREERFSGVLSWFEKNVPVAESELRHHNAFQFLIAVILSAQCTDKRVNSVTPALFDAFPTPCALAAASPDEVYPYIRSISYPNNKASHLVGMAKMLVSEFDSQVPADLAALQRLPGVGRKTANVVAAVIHHIPAMPVDTHVFRVSNRIGLTLHSKTPLETERQLVSFIPSRLLTKAHHWLILHGRYTCLARKPLCHVCGIQPWCCLFSSSSV
ncbi:MAG: endonuclease III [Tannerellaceae bacterium]|nr:endonuclease III [Tannerellaceae bacterium]